MLRDGTLNILEDFQYGRRFIEFLNFYRTGDYADAEVELIINGDFLNLLQIDYLGVHTYLISESMVSHAVRTVIAGHPEVFDALREFAASPGKEIAYVIGNHDIGLLFDEPRRILIETIGPNLRFYDTFYEFDRVRIEHGHMYEAINSTDPNRFSVHDPDYPEPVLNLPWASLFVTTFLPKLKKDRPFIDKVKPFTTYIRWAFLHDLIWSLKSGYYSGMAIIRMVLLARRHPLQDFRITWERFKNLTIYPSFMKEARHILRDNPHLLAIVFGHTHVVRYRQWGGGREYFNTGTWNQFTSLDIADFGLQTLLTYVQVEIPPEGSGQRPRLRIKEWRGQWRPEIDTNLMPVGR